MYVRKKQAAGHKVMAIVSVHINQGKISASVTYRNAKACLTFDWSSGPAHWRAVVAENSGRDQQKSAVRSAQDQVRPVPALGDATALRRGVSRLPLQRTLRNSLKMPRPCAVESHARR